VSEMKASHSTSARWEIKRLRENLEDLYVRADPRSIPDPEIASDLGRYLCIRVSGYLEQATSVIMRDYCHKNSGGNVQQFAISWLERMPNMSSDALLKLVGRFNETWEKELENFLSQEERKGSLNALIKIRNNVAHGIPQGLSRENAWSYYRVAEEIIEWLLDHFDSMNSTKRK
jgi:hypothetical protein